MRIETLPASVDRFTADVEALNHDEPGLGDQIRHWIGVYRRRAAPFWATFLVVLGAFLFYALHLTPRYTATATVVLDIRQRDVVDLDSVLSGVPLDSASVDTEVGIIRSREMARRVVDDLDLASDPEFNGRLREPSVLQNLRAQVVGAVSGLVTGIAGSDSAVASNADAVVDADDIEHAEIVNSLLSRLAVDREATTYLIDISIESENPRKAARIANAYADTYLLLQLEAKYEATRRANEWLNERLSGLREQVEEAEAAVEQFRTEAGLMSIEGATLVESQLTDLAGQLVAARAELADKESRLSAMQSQIASGGSIEAAGEVLNSQAIRQLRTQYTQVARERAEYEGTLGPAHPDMLRVNRELEDLRSQIEAEEQRVLANLQSEVRILRRRVEMLITSQDEATAELSDNNRSLVRLRELERNATAVRTLYESFLSRFRETSAQQGLEQSDARIISEASPPAQPSFPDKRGMLIRSVILALIAAIGLLVLLEMLEHSFRTDEDVERVLGAPVLGAVPLLRRRELRVDGGDKAPEGYLLARPFAPFSEAFRSLKSSILLSNVAEAPKVILVTSALPGEGKTLSTIAFARSLALSDSSVVMVDADLRRRDLTKRLGTMTESGAGLLQVLTKEAELDDALVQEDLSGAASLPLSASKAPTTEVFGSASFVELLEELKKRYDTVVIDSAPLLTVADSLTLAKLADFVLLVVQWGRTPRSASKKAIDDLRRIQAPIGGVLLNQVDPKSQTKYGGGYYKAYAHERVD